MKTELVTTLKWRATEMLDDLPGNRAPVLITQHGRPAAYLVDVASYEELVRKVSVLDGIALGERAYREGNVVSQAEAKKRFSRWLT